MRNIPGLIIALLLLSPFVVYAANNQICTPDGISKLKKEGWSIDEIRALCTNNPANPQPFTNQLPPQNMPAQQMGQRCATPIGVCGLYHLPPAPVGTPCYCINRYTGRPDNGYVIQ